MNQRENFTNTVLSPESLDKTPNDFEDRREALDLLSEVREAIIKNENQGPSQEELLSRVDAFLLTMKERHPEWTT